MQLTIQLHSTSPISLPIQYNHILQGIIYDSINQELATFLHDQGFQVGKRTFKLFTYSKLYGEYTLQREEGRIVFKSPIQWILSSPVKEFCHSIANGLLFKEQVRFGTNGLEVQDVQVQQPIVEAESIEVTTLSPVVAYSTLTRFDGRPYTCFYQPGDPDFNGIIAENLRKKYLAMHGEGAEIPAGEVNVTSVSPVKQSILNYKNTVIKGYSGKLRLAGPRELLQVAVDAGLGSKNSMGFGCVRLVQRRM